MSKKVKVKKIKKEKLPFKERLGGLFFTAIALILAIVVFAGFLFLQSYFSEKIVYKDVLVVQKEIPVGEIITKENYPTYFTKKQVNSLTAVKDSIQPKDYKRIYGMKSKVKLHIGEEVSDSDFINTNLYLSSIKDPIELSISTSGIGFTNGGKIRPGDVINIILMFNKTQLGIEGNQTNISTPITNADGTTSMGTLTQNSNSYDFESYARYMLENIYVEKVLTADGKEIAPTDVETSASIIVLIVPKSIELELNSVLANCETMRISKVLYEVTPKDLYKDPATSEETTRINKLDNEKEWVTIEGNAYKISHEGKSHYKRAADGSVIEELCTIDEATGICKFCGGKLETTTETTTPTTPTTAP